jgi:pimeloyl-ACP methyl ester carboxylesterase
MHVRELGEGPPVLLLHPGPGLDGTVFLPGVERLAESHRVLLADLPGNGHSPEGDPNEWTLAGFARAVERLATELELEDWTLLGHSFGGFVAMQHLVDFPGSASRIIASCTDASESPPPGVPEDLLEGLTAEQREQVEEGLAREQVASSPQQLKDAWLAQGARLAVSEAALLRMLRDVLFRPEMGRPRDWGDLEALTALAFTETPVLAIGAELDRAIPPEAARRIAVTAPRGELLMIEGVGHFPFAEAPDRYWSAVEAWLLRTAAGTAA